MSKSKDETGSQASARQSKLTVNLGLVFDSPEGKIGPLLKKFREQAQDERSLTKEIEKVDLSKHRLAKLGGALIKVAKEGDMANFKEILEMIHVVFANESATNLVQYVLAAFQLLCNSKNEATALIKDVLSAVELLCEDQRAKEEAGKVFLLPLIKEIQEDRSTAVKTLIAECINCLIIGAPENVQLFTKKRAPTRDLKAIVALIVTSPDYHMQGVLIEVLYRITRRDKGKWSPLFEDEEVDEAFWRIAGRSFRGDVRSFLNMFNDKLGAARQIFSFRFRKLFLNEVVSAGSENEWIDFGPTNICFWISSGKESVQCYIPFDTLVKTEFSGSYLVFEVSDSADLPEEVVDPNKKKPQLVSMLFDDKDIEAIKVAIEPLAAQLKFKKPARVENSHSDNPPKVWKAVIRQKPAEVPKKVLKIPRLQVSSVSQNKGNSNQARETVTEKTGEDVGAEEEDQRSTQPQEAEELSRTTQIGNMTFAIQKNKPVETQRGVSHSLFKESRDSRPASPNIIRTSRPPSPIEVALGVQPRPGRTTPLPSPSSPLSKSLRTHGSLNSDMSGPSWNMHKSSRAPSLSELDEISPERPDYFDREHLKPRRLFESPPASAVNPPPNNYDIDEIISEEIVEDAEMDVIPIEAPSSHKAPSTKEMMSNILERVQALEKMSTNQKMRKEIELTLKQLRMLETKFAEYNREHVQSILNDFSASVNAKLDQFLREKRAESENDSSHGTKRKLNELTVSLQEQCKKMKLLHRQVSTCIHSAEEVIKECDMQQMIIQNQESRASRQLDSDVASLKEEIRTDLELFKTSLQPLFKGTEFFRQQK